MLALVSVTVITTGLLDSSSGRAEAIAVLGFFGYALYLLTSAVAALPDGPPVPVSHRLK